MSNKISKHLQADWPVNMSYDKGNGDEIEKFYSGIRGEIREGSSIFYNKRQIDIFLLAMAIGKDMNVRKKLKIPSQTIRRDALTEEEVWLMCSVVLSEDDADLQILANPKELVKICEEYANGGIEYLIELNKNVNLNNKQYEDFLEDKLTELQNNE